MNRFRTFVFLFALSLIPIGGLAQTNPLWHGQKIKNYLPHMTRPEVENLLQRTDMALIPVPSLEQHGLHLPIGTDFLSGIGRAQLIAQETDVLVAPVLFVGNAPYHMGYAGTMTLSAETIQQVYFEAAQSLMQHGFKRFLIMNSHGGNRVISQYIVDRINHETPGIAVELGAASTPFLSRETNRSPATVFDRHGGVGETSRGLYMFPSLVDMDSAETATLTMPEHLERMLPEVVAGDPTVLLVLLAEGLKREDTGKKTSVREMSSTGVWGVRDLREASAERGEQATLRSVNAAVAFIERWKELRPREP